jgi:hypothetical protein
MEKVVYLLGAGFSAPLGLPVMSNFIEMAKDIYFSDTSKHKQLEKVIENLRDVGNHYFKSDIFNIEEVLSILATRDAIGNEHDEAQIGNEEYIGFLKYVLEEKTPKFHSSIHSGNWKREIFGEEKYLLEYGYFVMNLFNSFVDQRKGPYKATRAAGKVLDPRRAEYAVITLNYDMVLESALESAKRNVDFQPSIDFTNGREQQSKDGHVVPLLKLHGSIDKQNMIPPVWNKDLTDESIKTAWSQAYRYLREATQIRIFGYSLPDTDTNVRYLLKIATIDPPNLKRIDALFLDKRKETANRYKAFLSFPKFRWKEADVSDYLSQLLFATLDTRSLDTSNFDMKCNHLEDVHDGFFKDSHDLGDIED